MPIKTLMTTAALFLLTAGIAVAQESSNPDAPEKVAANKTLVYGQGEASLTCAPTKYCALALQTGEVIKSIDEPDKKWTLSPTVYGAGTFATPVVIVSPSAAGLSSDFTVTTDRRVYQLKLVSTDKDWTPTTAYTYP